MIVRPLYFTLAALCFTMPISLHAQAPLPPSPSSSQPVPSQTATSAPDTQPSILPQPASPAVVEPAPDTVSSADPADTPAASTAVTPVMQPDKAAPPAKSPAPGQLTPAEIKLRIQKIGRNYRVKIVKTDGTKIAGFINSIDADSFRINNGNAFTGFHFFTIPYADVATVRSPFHAAIKTADKTSKVVIVTGLIFVGTIVVVGIVCLAIAIF